MKEKKVCKLCNEKLVKDDDDSMYYCIKCAEKHGKTNISWR
jgi:hypothetical protein